MGAFDDDASQQQGDGGSVWSNMTSSVSDAWGSVTSAVGDAWSSAQYKFGGQGAVGDPNWRPPAKDPEPPIYVPMDNRPLDEEGHSPEQAQWIKDNPAPGTLQNTEDGRRTQQGWQMYQNARSDWEKGGRQGPAPDRQNYYF